VILNFSVVEGFHSGCAGYRPRCHTVHLIRGNEEQIQPILEPFHRHPPGLYSNSFLDIYISEYHISTLGIPKEHYLYLSFFVSLHNLLICNFVGWQLLWLNWSFIKPYQSIIQSVSYLNRQSINSGIHTNILLYYHSLRSLRIRS